MKKQLLTIVLLAFCAIIAGYLLSHITFIGRTGINVFYKEYKFLKSPIKAGCSVFVIWLLLYAIQSYVTYRSNKSKAIIVHRVAILLALAGLFYSYADFTNSFSHKMLGEKFHIGVYLFWLVWIAISIQLIAQTRIKARQILTATNNRIS